VSEIAPPADTVESSDEAVLETLEVSEAEPSEVKASDEVPSIVESSEVAESAEAVDPVEEFRRELIGQFGDWYVVHSYAGYENRVKANLESRTISLNMEDYIFQIEVPTEDVVEIKSGQRKNVRRNKFPGYVLVRLELTDESWSAVAADGRRGHGDPRADGRRG
jgi:transcriptional antiterminator NusG